jgi:3-dehydroquinate synthase
MDKKVTVNLGPRSYEIHIGQGLLEQVGQETRSLGGLSANSALISNDLVYGLYGERVKAALQAAGFNPRIILVPDGETHKSLEWAGKIYRQLIDHGLDRQSPIFALGGGVIGDLAGFCAATFLRGVPLIQIPTSLLAQVDSSVGGKVAVNLPQGKNLVGAFYQPRLVVIDPLVLRTLAPVEFKSGLAEVVKYGLILDADFFRYLEANAAKIMAREPEVLAGIIRICCRHKAAVVEKDEQESGLRAILNYGHTVGHALESLGEYRGLRHGEAIALGMVVAMEISTALGLTNVQDQERLANLLLALGMNLTFPSFSSSEVLEKTFSDKKVRAGKIKFVLTRGIGHAILYEDLASEMLLSFLQKYSGN